MKPAINIADQHTTDTRNAGINRAREKTEQEFIKLMEIPAFRKFSWNLLADSGVTGSSFSTDSHVTAFNEGRRSAGITLMTSINRLCPEQYAVMAHEAAQRQEELTNG